jgi:hypothetical protein
MPIGDFIAKKYHNRLRVRRPTGDMNERIALLRARRAWHWPIASTLHYGL